MPCGFDGRGEARERSSAPAVCDDGGYPVRQTKKIGDKGRLAGWGAVAWIGLLMQTIIVSAEDSTGLPGVAPRTPRAEPVDAAAARGDAPTSPAAPDPANDAAPNKDAAPDPGQAPARPEA